MSKSIQFTTHKDYLKIKEDYPEPIKLNIPDWFKDIEHKQKLKTVKGCIPFLETLTTGYVLKIPLDIDVRFNYKNKNGERVTEFTVNDNLYNFNLNSNKIHEYHPTDQFKNSPIEKNNLNYPVYKIMNPWIIKTPPGYSCLFVSPLNNGDDRFSIIPGIVHTDKFKDYINFPITINSDKHPSFNSVIKRGTPYVQIIPFKRESWKMNIDVINEKERDMYLIDYWRGVLRIYQNKIWDKISWK